MKNTQKTHSKIYYTKKKPFWKSIATIACPLIVVYTLNKILYLMI